MCCDTCVLTQKHTQSINSVIKKNIKAISLKERERKTHKRLSGRPCWKVGSLGRCFRFTRFDSEILKLEEPGKDFLFERNK